MKAKKILGVCVALGVLGYAGTLLAVHHEDQSLVNKRLNALPTQHMNDLSIQAMQVLATKGCQDCHQVGSPLPFYANVPFVKGMIQRDINSALNNFDIKPVLQDMVENKPVNQVALAKLDYVMAHNTMPIMKYQMIHWPSSYMSESDRQIVLNWIKQERETYYPNPTAAPQFQNLAVQPIHTVFKTDPAKVALGQQLYNNIHLSGDNTYSCSSCHSVATGGVDNLPTALGIENRDDPMNTPTVYNAVFNMSQFWNGRAKDLAAQAAGPIFNPVEMGSKNWPQILAKLNKDPNLVREFKRLYPNGMTGNNITNAIAQYESTLTTPNSPFDRYLEGDMHALNAQQIRGFHLFQQDKCSTCHAGQNMGGESYQIMGLYGNYFAHITGRPLKGDEGRYLVTHNPRDMHAFKVPSLRNIALTGPYFSGGRVATLSQAVQDMGTYEVGITLSKQENADIVAFLKTLTGQYQGKTLTNPNCHEVNGVEHCSSAKEKAWEQVTHQHFATVNGQEEVVKNASKTA